MVQNVEISSFDLRYSSYRMRNKVAEERLLCLISEHGIRDPLEGVDVEGVRILLNGFKRYRCAQRLNIAIVPYSCLGSDEVIGIIQLLRISNSKSLGILEQAKLIEYLRNVPKMSVLEIAHELERSPSWVSMRLGLMSEMSDSVKQQILNGRFPVYSYMYTLRQFIRMKYGQKDEVGEFVNSVAGKNLSVRDIERLAHGYFKGSEDFREQIRNGHILWGLERLAEASCDSEECNEFERGMLRDLEITQKYMGRVIHKSTDKRFKNKSFFVQANLLAGGILSKLTIFSKSLKEFYDRSGHA